MNAFERIRETTIVERLRLAYGSVIDIVKVDGSKRTINSQNLLGAVYDASGNFIGLMSPSGGTIPIAGISAEAMGASPSATAAVNTAAIQAALTRTGLVTLTTPGTYSINDTLTLSSETTFNIGAGVILQRAASTNKQIFKNAALSRATTAITSFTASASVGTVARTAHGKSVGDFVAIDGGTTSGYNGVYRILTVPDANSYTVQLPFAPTVTTCTGTIVERAADSNISIIGDGLIDCNGANQSSQGSTLDMGASLCFIHGLNIGVRSQNAKKYCWQIAGVTRMNCGVIRGFNNISTVMQLCAPIHDSHIEGIDCTSFDDVFAVLCGDYATYQLTNGDVAGLTIGFIKGYASATGAGIRLGGSSPFVINDITIGEIRGSWATNSPVYLLTDTNLQACVVNQLNIGFIEDYSPVNGRGAVHLNTNGTGTIVLDTLRIDGARIIAGSNILYALVYNVSATGLGSTLNRVFAKHIHMDGFSANSNMRVFKSISDITEAHLSDSYIKNCHSLYDHDSGGVATGQNVFVTNVLQTGCATGISFRRAINVHAQNWRMVSTGTAALSGSTGTLTLTGDFVADKTTNVSGTAIVQWKSGDITRTQGQITTAQLLAMNATPQTLVASPGASKALVLERAEFYMPYNTTAYAGIAAAEDLAIRYTNGSGVIVAECETTGFLDQASSQMRIVNPVAAAAVAPIGDYTPVANTPLVAHLLVGEITTGDSPVNFRVWTRTVDTAW